MIIRGVKHRIANDTYNIITANKLCTAINTALTGTDITIAYNMEIGLYQFTRETAFVLQANINLELLGFIGFDESIDHVASPMYETYGTSSSNAIDLIKTLKNKSDLRPCRNQMKKDE